MVTKCPPAGQTGGFPEGKPDRCHPDRCPADPTEGDIPEKILGIKDRSRTMYFIIINRDFILIGV